MTMGEELLSDIRREWSLNPEGVTAEIREAMRASGLSEEQVDAGTPLIQFMLPLLAESYAKGHDAATRYIVGMMRKVGEPAGVLQRTADAIERNLL